MRGRDGEGQTDRDTANYKPEYIAENRPKHVRSLCSQRETNPDFASSLHYRVVEPSIEANSGQQ
jgi:hypothetical protein